MILFMLKKGKYKKYFAEFSTGGILVSYATLKDTPIWKPFKQLKGLTRL